MVERFKQIKEVSIEPVKKEAFAPWALFMLISILPFLSMMSYLTTSSIIENQELDIDGRFMESMEITARNKAHNIDRFLEEVVSVSNRVTHSRNIQMFVMDVNESGFDEEFTGDLERKQLYIEEVLQTFKSQNNLQNVYLVNRRANIFVGTEMGEDVEFPLNYNVNSRDVFINKEILYSPLRMDGHRMLMDVYVPIYALKGFKGDGSSALIDGGESDFEETNQVSGVLIMTFSIKDKLIDLMNSGEKSPIEGQYITLFQEVSGGVEMVRLNSEHEGIYSQDKDALSRTIYKRDWDIYYLKEEGKHDLSKVPKFGTQSQTMPRPGEILTLKVNTKNLPLTIMVYLELQDAYKDLMLQRRQVHVIGQLIALIIFVFVLAFWWKAQDIKHRNLAEQFRGFSEKVNAQRRLLMSINTAVNEHISLKYFDGKYLYVNNAFCKFIKMKEDEILDKTDADIFGSKIAEELKEMDKEVLAKKQTVLEGKSFIIKDKRYHLEISKTPFLDGNKKFVGITTVVKDVTELVHERQLRDKAMKNSMRSMMRIMQRYDEHLVAHAKYLKSMVLKMAEHLNLSMEETTTLEVSANLSQLGKIYVAKDILSSKSELNDHDLVTYRAHIEDTAFILDTVDWGLPIVKTVYAMHERLDGTGYPNGLHAVDISKLSRILGVCDQFCELVSPRRGHKIYTPEGAIKWMVNQKGQFDLSILQSLAEVISEDESAALVV
ncbi:MAG: hypothetical protein CMF61_08125 [Magnetococcales bacterium]|nr:hypothetical protein [Magnetococcales bacterium]